MRRSTLLFVIVFSAVGCICGPAGGELSDAGLADDVGPSIGADDAGTEGTDAALPDGSAGPDASATEADSGVPIPADAGSLDASVPADAGAGPADASMPPDAGSGGDDVWMQLDYSSAYTPSSPAWSFSATPGWGPAEWAMEGDTWPQAWDRWNNMSVADDPIGTSLEIGPGSELQVMIGLEELSSYQNAVVHLEGRSCATSSSVSFDVYNPLNGCGASGTMSNDWTVHAVDLDLGDCLLTGSGAGVEAVRVSPTDGTLALVRMRVTLRGARW